MKELTPQMAEIGRILYLPPPTAAPGRTGEPGRVGERAPAAAVETDSSNADSTQARAKQFRFRVYDGGRPDQVLVGDNGLPTRRTGTARPDDAQNEARDGNARGQTETGAGSRQNFAGFATASAPFLAQLIAQEQLQAGLHDPPLRQADRAYRQAGGEPALRGTSTARFQIAV